MRAKILLVLVSTSLAATALQAQFLSQPGFSKRPAPPAEAGPASSMKVANPLQTAPVATTDATGDTKVFSGDPNETSSQLIERYQRAHRLIAQGAWVRAQLVLERALVQFPESRHLHQLMAELLWYKSLGTDRSFLQQSAQEATQAMDIGLGFGTVDYNLTNRLQQTLGKTGDLITLDRLFGEALTRDRSATVYLHYALGLNQLKDPRTEEMFKKAVELEPEGDALAGYGEWLLEHQRAGDAMDRLPKSSNLYYLNFLRGVALERQNHLEEARAAYVKFRDYSTLFPAPARFRIAGSSIQPASGIRFDDEVSGKITATDAINGLSYLIYGEARGESYGGMVAEGWVVRARTLRGSVGSPTCPAVSNSGATLADKYKSVMCQGSGSQFNGVCLAWCSNTATTSCSHTASTDTAAYDVYYGYGADPVSGHCPSGVSQSGSYCDGSIRCLGNVVTYRLASPLFNLGTSSTCGSTCAPTSNGKICSNGGLDNCFYSNPSCAGVGRVSYTGTLSGTGSNSFSNAFLVSASGNFNGHLEGPETQDFDLYLQSSSSSSGPWTDVASSALVSAVEEINYSGGPNYYRWRAYSYSGSGSFTLCTKTP